MLLSTLRRHMEQRRIERNKREDLNAAAGMDVSSVRTLCLALGPYRSYTTVTASLIARHPQCQAINHGGRSILGDHRLDFISRYRPHTADRFLRYGLHISNQEKHRSDSRTTPRPAGSCPTSRPRAFLWNDPVRTSHHLRRHNVDIGRLLESDSRLRFLQTIRNPIDCAYSISRNGLAHRMGLDAQATLEEILECVLNEIRWFKTFERAHPQRFHAIFADGFDREQARRLAAFLQVDAPDSWVEQVHGCFDYPRSLSVSPALRRHYEESVGRNFEEFPDTRERLLALLER